MVIRFCWGAALASMLAAHAHAQPAAPLRIWDIPFGTQVRDLPADEFVDPACGTNGGPPSLMLAGFHEFAKCPAESSGLREVWFIYDDEEEYIARAWAPTARMRNPDLGQPAEDRAVTRARATQVNLQPVILSLLIDGEGRVQGYRIFTDPRADPDTRLVAVSLANVFRGRYGFDGWTCIDLAPAPGEKPIGTPPNERFTKEHCEKAADGRHITVEARNYYKPGQTYLDPFTRQPMVNEFESSARVEVVRIDALPR